MSNGKLKKYDDFFNNKNRHDKFKKENYATKIISDAKCSDNENLVSIFAQLYAINALKNMPPIYRCKLFQPMVDSIKSTINRIFSVEKISEMEKSIDYEKEYKECKAEAEKAESNMNTLLFIMCSMK